MELLSQDKDSLSTQLSDKVNIVHKLFEIYKSFEFLELDITSYCSRQSANYYEQNVGKNKFSALLSILNFDKSFQDPLSRAVTTITALLSLCDLDL